MNKLDHLYEPHLVLRKFSILAGKEWYPGPSDWSIIQVEAGVGYWLYGQSSAEVQAGCVMLIGSRLQGYIRASQLNSMSLNSFSVVPSRLTGLITLKEQDGFRSVASQPESACRVFPVSSPIALKMAELCARPDENGLLFRLMLLQLFIEIVGKHFEHTTTPTNSTDARERLRGFLASTPPYVLSEMTFDELARITRCTPRHLSRIFFEQAGMSFSDKRTEIRLARACEFLATSKSKVVEVAFESGYRSLSLFNEMFTRRFGLSPGKWRQRYRSTDGGKREASARRAVSAESIKVR